MPPQTAGEPGTCTGDCAAPYVDEDRDGVSCEAYCAATAGDDATCDGLDDDCDNEVDEDVDLCSDAHCGGCGWDCVLPHAQTACRGPDGQTCTRDNAACVVTACACAGPGDCYHDVDHVAANGCEYRCDPAADGIERLVKAVMELCA